MFHATISRLAGFSILTALLCVGQQSSQSGLQDQVVAAERAELDALKSGDLAAFADLIADEAIFADAAGPATKAQIVKNVAGFRLHDYTMSNIQVLPLSADSGLIVYRVAQTGTSHGQEFTAKVLVSAIWTRRNGKWVCIFSQETAAN